MKNRFTKEFTTALFYIICILITCFSGISDSGGPCVFNFIGALWLLFFIGCSLILFSVHLYRFFKGNKSYVGCLLVHCLAWLGIFIIGYFMP